MPIWYPSSNCSAILSLPKRLSFRLLVRWLRQDSCFLHLSLKCFRSLIPVAVQIVSVPGLWNNRQGKQKNASLTEQPANQLRLAYRLEEKLRVYVLPRSMLCCCIFKSGRSGPMSFSLFLSTSDRRLKGASRRDNTEFSVAILTESKSLLAMLLT